MATKLVHSQIPPPQILPYSISSPPKMLRSQSQRTPSSSSILSIHGRIIGFRPISTIKVAEQSANLVGEKEEEETSEEPSSQPRDLSINRIKAEIDKVLLGINRGIFGIPSKRKSEIEGLVKLLEPLNPNPRPTVDLEKLSGCWKLIYSTITILGSKRTKLGLRDFISLGDFFQVIDVTKMKAVNVIKFNVRGLNLFNGKLIIEASFKISSESRVDIRYNTSTILPDQLMNMFCKNYDLLLGIFNPDGWLEITYVDDTLRIGRDDKGNIFILERSQETNP